MQRITFAIFAFVAMYLALLLGLPLSAQAQPLAIEQVSLQLDWKYQFEYAGFIVAKEKGFYADAGLNVTLLEYQPKIDIVADVLAQKTTYGIHNSSLVIHDGKIQPMVLLATYFQRSPLVFVTQKEIKEPIDLVGKTIMLTKNEAKHSSLALLLNKFGIDHDTNIIEHTFNIQDFIDGNVDAMSAFRTNQIYDLNKQNIPHSIIDPADYGFIMTAVNVFTSKAETAQHPERTRRFIEASNRGWSYALDNIDEVVKLIHAKYAPHKTIEALMFEANITKKMLLRDLYPIGSVNKELTLRTYKQLHNLGKIDDNQRMNQVVLFDDEKNNQLNFTNAELDYLAKKQEITMCVDPDWMPFEHIKDGIHYGIAADYMALFQEKLPIPIRLIPTQSWQESIQQAQKRSCDILSLAASTTERNKYMRFTPPYVSIPVVIATTTDKIFINNIKDITGKKVGIVRGYAIGEEMRSRHPEIN
ncbi:MAG: ABC transporter substrate-binding protein, partial [Thermodesulfobacteriota bacterium]|nr:ABC transporter substrate-binding protein [Thermodesulfobacteriota bacterium]